MSGVTLAGVRMAAHDNRQALHRTPLVPSSTLSRLTGFDLFLKLENLQKTGSFKPRGALHNMRRLSAEDRKRGVVTISAGNHAQGVAYAGSVLGIATTVVMPENASPAKARAAREYGARVVLHGDVQGAFRKLEEIRNQENLAYVHAFDDPRTVEGQGTVGLEVCEDLPSFDAICAGIGGGGLISGIAFTTKSLRPQILVAGVEPEGAAAMHRSRLEGKPVRLDRIATIADGLAPPFVGELNFGICREQVDEVVLVSDEEIRAAVRILLERCKLLVEPAGAAALAALLHGKIEIPRGRRVVCVLSGGNLDLDRLKEIL